MSFLLIEIFELPDGKAPFRDWLESIRDISTRDRILKRLDRLRFGNYGDHKSVGEGVWEVRLDFGPGYRVYYAQQSDRIIILLSGGDKSSQSRDILRAREYWQSFQDGMR